MIINPDNKMTPSSEKSSSFEQRQSPLEEQAQKVSQSVASISTLIPSGAISKITTVEGEKLEQKNELSEINNKTQQFLSNQSITQTPLDQQRQARSKEWKGTDILTCSPQVAKKAMQLHHQINYKKNNGMYVGDCVLFWKQNSADEILILEQLVGNKTQEHSVKVQENGQLLYQNKLYTHPKELVQSITNQRQVIVQPIKLDFNPFLQAFVTRSSHSPYLSEANQMTNDQMVPLLEVAFTDHQPSSLKNLIIDLKNTFKNDPKASNNLLHHALDLAIKNQDKEMIDFIVKTWDQPEEISSSLNRGLHTENQAAKMTLNLAAQLKDKPFLTTLLHSYNKVMPKLTKEEINQIMIALVKNSDSSDELKNHIQAFFPNQPLDKEQVSLLLENESNPTIYLDCFLSMGGKIEDLDVDTKEQLLNKMTEEKRDLTTLTNFLSRFPGIFPDMSFQILCSALSCDLKKKNSLELFSNLLKQVPEFSDVENEQLASLLASAPIACNQLVLNQYNTLQTNKDFLLSLFEKACTKPNSHVGIANLSFNYLLKLDPTIKNFLALGEDNLAQLIENPQILENPKVMDQLNINASAVEQINNDPTILSNDLKMVKHLLFLASPETKLKWEDESEPLYSLLVDLNNMPDPFEPTKRSDAFADVIASKLHHDLIQNQDFKTVEEILQKSSKNVISAFWKTCLDFQPGNLSTEKNWSELAKNTMPLMDDSDQSFLLTSCSIRGDVNLANLIIQNGRPVTQGQLETFLNDALLNNDTRMLEIALQSDLKNNTQLLNQPDDFRGRTLLHKAIEKNNTIITQFLLEKGAKADIKDSTGKDSLQLAKDGDMISICRLLQGNTALEDIAKTLSKESPEKIQQILIKEYLNSSQNDMNVFISLLEKNCQGDVSKTKAVEFVKGYMENGGALISRFTSPEMQKNVFANYGKKYQNYQEQQIQYGNTRFNVYQTVLKEAQKNDWPLIQIYHQLAKGGNKDADFQSWRLGRGSNDSKNKTPMHTTYFRFWNLANTIQTSLAAIPEGSSYKGLNKMKDGYQVEHQLDDGRIVKLTRVELGIPKHETVTDSQWHHTDLNNLPVAFEALSNLFDEIKALPKGETNEPSSDLKVKIAKFYWLASHCMPTDRGNSQSILEIHRFLYEIHGFKAAPPAQKWVLPDCVALCLPFEEFYDKYYDSLFEHPPQPINNKA